MQLRRQRTSRGAPDPLNLSVNTVVGSKQTQLEVECLGICTRAFFSFAIIILKKKGEKSMSVKQEAAKLNTGMRNTVPLVHNITNYVTVNDCANALLAIGASPIMADDMLEAADITAISSALVINIGTLNQRTIESMILAGKRANELGIPVVFDPVGAGASKLRNETTQRILEQVEISILRGNLSEVSYVAGLSASTKGGRYLGGGQ